MSSTETSNRKRRRASSTSTHHEESTSSIVIRPRTTGMAVASSTGFESLADDILDLILQFVGKRSYGSYGKINKRCHMIFLGRNLPKETFFFGCAPLWCVKMNAHARYSCYSNYPLAQAVVAYNRNDILQWVLLEKRTLTIVRAFDIAAGVSLNALKRVMNFVGNDDFISMKVYEGWHVCREAASHERLDVLKWLKSNGWFDPSEIENDHIDPAPAAINGNMPVLEWFVENGCSLSKDVFSAAARGGHLNVLEFLKRKQCPLDPKDCMLSAAAGGRMESIHWVLQNGCSFENVNIHTIYQAAAGGHLHAIKFFIENGYSINDIDEEVSYKAARAGHLNVLQWLHHDNNLPFDEVTFEKAARSGNIENLQWLLDNNCPWNKKCYSEAAYSKKLEVLEWLKKKGCPRGDSVLKLVVFRNVESEVKNWLRENEFTLHITRKCLSARRCPFHMNISCGNNII